MKEKNKRGGKRKGAGRPKKLKMPAGHPTNPDASVIRQSYDYLDAHMAQLVQEGVKMALNPDTDPKIKARLINDLISKRMPTATGIVDLTEPVNFDMDELENMSIEELQKMLQRLRDVDSRKKDKDK